MGERYAPTPAVSPRGYNPTRPMNIAVTGTPGVGKSTLVARVADRVPLSCGGMVTAAIQKCGRRVGFAVQNLATGEEGVLAHLHGADGPRFGRYRLNLRDLEAVGVGAIARAIEEAALVVVDEVGPMELCSSLFIQTVKQALDEAQNLLVTVHRRSNHPLAYMIRHRADHLVRLTRESRDAAVSEIIQWLTAGHTRATSLP